MPPSTFNQACPPELEHLMRTNVKDQPTVSLRGNVEVTDVAQDGQGRVRVDFTDRLTGEHESVLGTYVLGCDGANSVVRTAIGSTMEDLKFGQRWLVIDVASMVELPAANVYNLPPLSCVPLA